MSSIQSSAEALTAGLQTEIIWELLERNDLDAQHLLGRIAVWYGEFYDVEMAGVVDMTFVPGAPVEQVRKAWAPWAREEPTPSVISAAAIPVRTLFPKVVDGQRAVCVNGVTGKEHPYFYTATTVTIDYARHFGHSFLVVPREEAA